MSMSGTTAVAAIAENRSDVLVMAAVLSTATVRAQAYSTPAASQRVVFDALICAKPTASAHTATRHTAIAQ
jgi:hypothetical protein